MLGVYNFGATITGVVLAIGIISIGCFVSWKCASAFVNDSKPVFSKHFETFWDEHCFREWGWVLLWGFFALLATFLVALVWPLASILGIVYGTLHLLRFLFRIKKKLGKVSGVAHGHPDSVEKTAFED